MLGIQVGSVFHSKSQDVRMKFEGFKSMEKIAPRLVHRLLLNFDS